MIVMSHVFQGLISISLFYVSMGCGIFDIIIARR